jgi:hypothetical protein
MLAIAAAGLTSACRSASVPPGAEAAAPSASSWADSLFATPHPPLSVIERAAVGCYRIGEQRMSRAALNSGASIRLDSMVAAVWGRGRWLRLVGGRGEDSLHSAGWYQPNRASDTLWLQWANPNHGVNEIPMAGFKATMRLVGDTLRGTVRYVSDVVGGPEQSAPFAAVREHCHPDGT